MKLLLVDFDGTLADINEFKERMVAGFANACHTDIDTIRKFIASLYNAYGIIDWEPFYVETMRMSSLNRDQIKDLLFEPMKYVSLNPLVVSYTQTFEGYKILFSYGETDFQNAKIEITQSDKLVDLTWITQTPKTQALSEKMRDNAFLINDKEYTEITLIDDNEVFLREVREQFPSIHVINVEELL
jgi:hypothetical protein